MTTVCFDGVRLACDSRRTADDRIDPFDARPKIRVVKGVVFAWCGTELWAENFPNWYADQKKPYPIEKDEGTEIAVFDKGKWRAYFADTTFPQILPDKWAIGSGEIAAYAAMLCKRNAPQSVLVATKLDKNSGGPIFGAELTDLLLKGDAALIEYKNGKARKPARPSKPILPRKGGRDNCAVRNGRNEPARRGA